jgi:hypothetical protein
MNSSVAVIECKLAREEEAKDTIVPGVPPVESRVPFKHTLSYATSTLEPTTVSTNDRHHLRVSLLVEGRCCGSTFGCKEMNMRLCISLIGFAAH